MESVSLFPIQMFPVVGWKARVRGCASGFPPRAPSLKSSLLTAGVPDPNAGAHRLEPDGLDPVVKVFTARLGLISAAAAGFRGHASSIFKSKRSTVLLKVSSPLCVGSAGRRAWYRMQWSMTAYAGCTAASKNL